MTRTHAAAWALSILIVAAILTLAGKMMEGLPVSHIHESIVLVEKAVTEREILLCVTAVCSLPDSDLKRAVLRELVTILQRLNNPQLQSLEA